MTATHVLEYIYIMHDRTMDLTRNVNAESAATCQASAAGISFGAMPSQRESVSQKKVTSMKFACCAPRIRVSRGTSSPESGRFES